MQEKNQGNTDAPELTGTQHLLDMLRSAESAIFVEVDATGALLIRCVTTRGEYQPETDAADAYVAAVKSEHQHLIDVVNGRTTDAGRFRALRDFAVLANTDKERFEVVNGMLSSFELDENMPPETQRTAADHNTFADFLMFALAETEPVLTAPTAAPAEPKFQLRDAHGNVLN